VTDDLTLSISDFQFDMCSSFLWGEKCVNSAYLCSGNLCCIM